MVIRIGTRGSKLALWQANYVGELIKKKFPDVSIEIVTIKTTGDNILDKALFQINDKGLFTKELETELIAGNIDIAVHSLKDLPTELPEGLKIGAVTQREIPNDVLIAKNKETTLNSLPKGAIIATSSLRRRAQLLIKRDDFQMTDIRGNVNTRIEKLFKTEIDGLVLAYAGVKRLGLEEYISQVIPIDEIIPAVGQASIAIETKIDTDLDYLLSDINDEETFFCISTEREFLKLMGGGCSKPIAAFCQRNKIETEIIGIISTSDGKNYIKDKIKKPNEQALSIGKDLAARFDKLGSKKIINLL